MHSLTLFLNRIATFINEVKFITPMHKGQGASYQLICEGCRKGGGRSLRGIVSAFITVFFFLFFAGVVSGQQATITGTTAVCQGATSQPLITFTYTGGNAPYTFYYTINNGTELNVTTTSGNSVTVSASTGTPGVYIYELIRSVDNGGITLPGGGATATITVNEAPVITTQPTAISRAIGCSADFSVVAEGSEPLSFQWRKNGTNIPGATASSYSIGSVSSGDAGNYDVVVTNACGSVTSTAATLTVNPPLVAGTHNTDAVTGCSNYNPAPLIVSGTTGGSGAGTYTYQWLENGNPVGTNSDTYDPGNLVTPGTYVYSARITDACGTQVTTATKTITIVADPTVTITGATNVCEGASLVLGTNISGGTGLYD
ncbi:MAG TPA: immunoglobulin domain-containing protein, partial [Flavisolibacter sp.]|nr:immunoglobulin domain-containing protein [Flavisolibacter sp.]